MAKLMLLGIALTFLGHVPLAAEVIITRSLELPDLDSTIAVMGDNPRGVGDLAKRVDSFGLPARVWFTPFLLDVTAGTQDASLWAVRNANVVCGPTTSHGCEPTGPVVFKVLYRTNKGRLIHTEAFSIPVHGVKTRNIREVGLRTSQFREGEIDEDGFARGYVSFFVNQPDGEINVDAFRVDKGEGFATGDLGISGASQGCQWWQVRFLDFGGPGDGSVVSVLVDPLNESTTDKPFFASGEAYNEQGEYLNSFLIRTDQNYFEFAMSEVLMTAGEKFGSIQFVTEVAGYVSVRHEALGSFSVSHPAHGVGCQ